MATVQSQQFLRESTLCCQRAIWDTSTKK